MKKKPPEGSLLYFVLFLTVGMSVAQDGTFSHFTIGTWSGRHISTAGWLMSGWSIYAILSYFRGLWPEARQHRALVVFFGCLLAAGACAPFICARLQLSAHPIYWGIPLLIIGHFVHKTLTKGLGPTTTSTLSPEAAPSASPDETASSADDKMKHEWSGQRIGIGAWAVAFAALLVALVYPVSIGIVRLFIVTAVPLLWISAIFLARRKKVLSFAIALIGVLVVGFAAIPSRLPDPGRLRQAYLEELRSYQGTRYVWGGENLRGIDCSGLVRRALINAHARLAVRTFNPRALRTALDLWWHDCSAQALGEQYRGFTIAVCKVSSANTADESVLQPGDLGVTLNGVHVLAYLGDREWIQAEPGLLKVLALRSPSQNVWMNQPLNIVRWTMMTDSADQAPENTARKNADPQR